MGLLKMFTRKRPVDSGSLGAVNRSTGYLQGGYKDSTVHSKVQMFNTLTQVGRIVYDTGYQRNYRPGVSGNYSGYFNISDAAAYNKFNYITSAAFATFTTPKQPSVSLFDAGIYTQAWLLCTTLPSMQEQIDDWQLINLSTDTPTSQGNLSASPYGSTRQGLSTGIGGFVVNRNTQTMFALNYTTKSISSYPGVSQLDTGIQVPCGMTKDDSRGYVVGYLGRNVRMNLVGASIASMAVATSYSYNFGESHSINSSTEGFMMAGYADTTGRYGNTQHALCQKINFTTEAITTLPDLVLAQSSGQMMQGF